MSFVSLGMQNGGRPLHPLENGEPNCITRRRLGPLGATALLCLVGVVLPNLFTLGASLYGIGMPPRTSAIAAYACVVLLARRLPFAAVAGLFVLVVAYDAASILALHFGLAPSEIMAALHLSAEIDLFGSSLYRALIASALALVAVQFWALRRFRGVMARGSAVVLTTAALAYVAADFLANTSAHYRFGTLFAPDGPTASAAEESGFREAALGGESTHALLVVVEALGHFADPAHQALLLEPFGDPDLLRRYRVESGRTTYFGSTTAGEMRELCASREPYGAVLEGRPFDCLPARFAARGHRTVAMHNFTRAFFERADWYPRLGFTRQVFGEDLASVSSRRCGGAFKGLCDADLVPVLAREFRDAAGPTFAYWLTLSTHVPVPLKDGTGHLGCGDGGPVGHPVVCRMTELWTDLFARLAATTADLPPTEILIVGDHAPPLWSRSGRELFEPGQVSWIRLSPRPRPQAGLALVLRGAQE